MTRLLVGTDSVETSEQLGAYLERSCDGTDSVYVVNSLLGGGKAESEEIGEGTAAIETIEERLDGVTTVETDQFVRGNEPIEDLLAAAEDWNADEYVIGVQKRSAIGKVLFGSTAQTLLLEAGRPVRCVPLVGE